MCSLRKARLTRDVTAGDVGLEASPAEVAADPELWLASDVIAAANTPVEVLPTDDHDHVEVKLWPDVDWLCTLPVSWVAYVSD